MLSNPPSLQVRNSPANFGRRAPCESHPRRPGAHA